MDWKKFGKKLLFPPIWLLIVLTLISGAALIFVFAKGLEESPIAYGVYTLAFYTLSVVCVFCVIVLPRQHKQLKKKLCSNPLVNRYLADQIFQMKVSLHLSLGINLLYAAINLLSWYLYRSWWFVCLVLYYAILSVMRYLLVRYVRWNTLGGDRLKELKCSLACSCILLLVNFFLSGAVLMIIYQNKGCDYHGILIYAMALYTFYTTINAIIDIIKYRKMENPVMTTAKVISMAAALVSMLNLETAMFAQFGADMPLENQRLTIMLTGAGVAITVVVMSAIMIVRCGKEISKSRRKQYG